MKSLRFLEWIGRVCRTKYFYELCDKTMLQMRALIDLHNPSASVASKLGYPHPIISHEEGRQRALERFKNAGAAT
ncbi:hypothetical protein C8R41DRAFT_843875, partial [Lentinula lateritia]